MVEEIIKEDEMSGARWKDYKMTTGLDNAILGYAMFGLKKDNK